MAAVTSAISARSFARTMPPPCARKRHDPERSEIASIFGLGGPRSAASLRKSLTSSDDPPPISNKIAPFVCGSISAVQPLAANKASVSRSTISSSIPTVSRTRLRKSAQLSASRQASVAIRRARVAPRLVFCRGDFQRSIGA